ncbi:hypothetical protein ACFL20_13885 [Spirochaetota bacterium]
MKNHSSKNVIMKIFDVIIEEQSDKFSKVVELISSDMDEKEKVEKLTTDKELGRASYEYTYALQVLLNLSEKGEEKDDKDKYFPPTKRAKIQRIASKSPFTKNRKEKLVDLMENIYWWKETFMLTSRKSVSHLNAIFPNIDEKLFDGLTPIPYSMLSRWISSHVPLRKPVGKFQKDIIEKIGNSLLEEFFFRSYRLDSTGEKYVLKNGLSDYYKKVLWNILEGIGYTNQSGSKYKVYLDFLIREGTLVKRPIPDLIINQQGIRYYMVNL